MRYPAIPLSEIYLKKKWFIIIAFLIQVIFICLIMHYPKILILIAAPLVVTIIFINERNGLILLIFYIFLINPIQIKVGPYYLIKLLGIPFYTTELFAILIVVSFISKGVLRGFRSHLFRFNILDKLILIYSLITFWGIIMGLINGGYLFNMILYIRYYLWFPLAYFVSRIVIKNNFDIKHIVKFIIFADLLMVSKWIMIHLQKLYSGISLSTPVTVNHENLFFLFFCLLGFCLFITGQYLKRKYFLLFILTILNLYLLLFGFRRAFWVGFAFGLVALLIVML